MIAQSSQSELQDAARRLEVCVITYLPSPYQVELFNEVAKEAKVHLRVIYLKAQDHIHAWGPVSIVHEHLILDGTRSTWQAGQEWCARADLTIFNFYTHPFALAAIACKAISGKPWVFWGEKPGVLQLGRLGRFGRKVLLAPIRWCHAPVWGVGRAGVSGYQQDWGPDHHYVNFPYYSNLKRFRRSTQKTPSKTRTLLFSGLLSARKGVLELAIAFAKVASEFPHLRLVILGSGPLQQAMKEHLEPCAAQVTWLGFQPWDRLPECYAKADVLCLPTRHDGWGMVVPEALAAGLPVLATRASVAATELIEDQVSGWLIPDANVTTLTQALRTVAALPSADLAQMSLAASARVATHQLDEGADRFAKECLEAIQVFHCHLNPKSQSARPESQSRQWSLLVTGSYEPDQLHSMNRYTKLVAESATASGANVTFVSCPELLGRYSIVPAGIRKWLGHIDKYLLFPLNLRWVACHQKQRTLIHVTDQGLGPVLAWVKDFPHVITCHDLIAIRSALGDLPYSIQSRWGTRFQRLNFRVLQQAHLIVCVSKKTQADCLRVLGQSIRCEVVLNPLDPSFLEAPKADSQPNLPERFLLHVGNSLWYKNRPGVLNIFHRLKPHRTEKLVLMGSAPTPLERQMVSELGLSEEVIWISHPPTDWIKAAYDKAVALIFPSLEEGFGWPVLEAMARGCPAFVSNRPPMTEVGGEAVVYFDPESPEEAAKQIHFHLGLGPQWRNDQRRKGAQRAALFSIASFNHRMAEAYQTAFSLSEPKA